MVHIMHALSLVAAASTVLALKTSENNTTNIVPGAYIVEFEGDKSITQAADQFHAQTESDYDVRLQFDYQLFKGVSIQFSNVSSAEERAAELASLPAVKNIWPVKVLSRAKSENGTHHDRSNSTPSPLRTRDSHLRKRNNGTTNANAAHVLTQVDKLHRRGITGKGVKIAIVDDGIDYHHPALGGCFGEGCLVVGGYDLVGDFYSDDSAPVPDDDPDDRCGGLGTNVAGIIAAGENRWGFTGVAPGATLAAYRVFGCPGITTADIVIKAFNMAYEDGADIITASVGAPNGWSGEPWVNAISRIVDKGVPCILGAGESFRGLFDTIGPGDGRGVTAVATFENSIQPISYREGFYTIGNGSRTSFPYEWSFPTEFDGLERPVWVTGYDWHNNNDACEPLPDDTPDLSDFYVLVRRGDCDYVTQAINVAAKGARYFVVYNDRPGLDYFGVDGYEGTENILGAGMVPKEIGEAWVRALENGVEVKAEIFYYDATLDYFIIEPNQFGPGAASTTTGWGPTYEMDFKPQFGAPGNGLLSTSPLEIGSYASVGGSHFAAAYAAGAYALVAEARGIKPEPALFESLLASTAKPERYYQFNGFMDWLAPAAQQGAGLIQVFDAAFSGTYLETSSLSFNDTDHFTETLQFVITNQNDNEISYELGHNPTYTFYTFESWGPYPYKEHGEVVARYAGLTFEPSAGTIAPGESVTVEVTANPPTGVDNSRYPYWSGYISVDSSDGSSLSLPYQGLTGSLHNVPVATDFTWITNSACHPIHSPWIPPNTTFTLPPPGEDRDPLLTPLPRLHADLAWGSPLLTAEVVRIGSCLRNSTLPGRNEKKIGEMFGFPDAFIHRDTHDYVWFGQLQNGDFAPPGRYKIVVKYLRIFGDESKDEDWMVAETTPFQIRYGPTTEDPSHFPPGTCHMPRK
ncbi:Minor extracellular protease vpr [Paramyrothecium foliicola]|nr:Minor extracellular protease vpr [Paramyrothecium foliicola]